MSLIRYFPTKTAFPFMKWTTVTVPLSAVLSILSIVLVLTVGLNLGIDFRGGTLIEVATRDGPVDIEALRAATDDLGLGNVEVQAFGAPNVALVRVERQDGGDEAQQRVVGLIGDVLGDTVEFRRTEVVEPAVSSELARNGAFGIAGALVAVFAYLWLRFRWQYAVGAILTTINDVILTVGLFAALQIDFNLSSIAAILLVLGYSLNDTIVVYDRIREHLGRREDLPRRRLIDRSINETLSRTLITSTTTLLALVALYLFGGPGLANFTLAMIWGVVVGTFSSIFLSAPLLTRLRLRPDSHRAG